MKVFLYIVAIVIYLLAVSYLLLGALGFSFGLRVAGNTFADEGPGLQRTTYFVLLGALACIGFYSVWRIKHRG
jgi:hypothetical protein